MMYAKAHPICHDQANNARRMSLASPSRRLQSANRAERSTKKSDARYSHSHDMKGSRGV